MSTKSESRFVFEKCNGVADMVDITLVLTYHTSMNIERDPSTPGRKLIYPFFAVANGTPYVVPSDDVMKCRQAACHWGKRHGVRLLVRKKGGEHICERVD